MTNSASSPSPTDPLHRLEAAIERVSRAEGLSRALAALLLDCDLADGDVYIGIVHLADALRETLGPVTQELELAQKGLREAPSASAS